MDGISKAGLNCYHLRELAILSGMKTVTKSQIAVTKDDIHRFTGNIDDDKVNPPHNSNSAELIIDKVFHIERDLRNGLAQLELQCKSTTFDSSPHPVAKFHLTHPSVRLWDVPRGAFEKVW